MTHDPYLMTHNPWPTHPTPHSLHTFIIMKAPAPVRAGANQCVSPYSELEFGFCIGTHLAKAYECPAAFMVCMASTATNPFLDACSVIA